MRWPKRLFIAVAVIGPLIAVTTVVIARSGDRERSAADLLKGLVIKGEDGAPAPSSQSSVPPADGAVPDGVDAASAEQRVTGVVVTARGVPVPTTGQAGDGWQVITPCGNVTTVKAQRVGPVDVVIDPGHGGSEPGAVGPNGLREKDLNFAVSVTAANALAKSGLRVLITRTGDYRSTLASRGLLSQASKPKAFVSIHHNAASTNPWPRPGSEVYHQVGDAQSRRLGGLIYEEITRVLSTAKGVNWVAGKDPGVKVRLDEQGEDYYGVVRRTRGAPGVLAELAFISNPTEADLLGRAEVQRAEGDAVARGVLRFLHTNDPGTGFVDQPAPVAEPAGPGGGNGGCVDPPL